MKKLCLSAALLSANLLAQEDDVNFNNDMDPDNEVKDDIMIDDDGVFEEDWDFVPSEESLKPNEIFSCKDQFTPIEWDAQELSKPVRFITAGNEKQIYGLGVKKSESIKDGYPIFKYDQEAEDWVQISQERGAIRMALDTDGSIWIVNAFRNIFHRPVGSKTWKRVFGKASMITTGPDGSVFILGSTRQDTGYSIFKLNRQSNLW